MFAGALPLQTPKIQLFSHRSELFPKEINHYEYLDPGCLFSITFTRWGFAVRRCTTIFCSAPVARLEKLSGWLDHLQGLGANALYLGPLFESSAHGYDTADFFTVDRRLGNNQTLRALSQTLHARGFRLILDGVFNHVGRDFWAFRDVRQNLDRSLYCDWFQGLSFQGQSPYGDPFVYQGWNGHFELVKLNLRNPQVRAHLFEAIAMWQTEFAIDGLRLDVADHLDPDFLRELSAFCRRFGPDFWLMGEAIHGDYRRLANPEMLDSTTNYECYKGLYSSHVDRNYFEIAYSLNRQFGEAGLYRDLLLYNFADNHDVNRLASSLSDPAHLYPLHILLMTMPGAPSIYYGSEWGIEGKRTDHSDAALRPCLDLARIAAESPQPDLAGVIARLAVVRRSSPALTRGDYRQLLVRHEQLVFQRRWEAEYAVVVVNASHQPANLEWPAPLPDDLVLQDRLNPTDRFSVRNGKIALQVPPCWGRILVGGKSS